MKCLANIYLRLLHSGTALPKFCLEAASTPPVSTCGPSAPSSPRCAPASHCSPVIRRSTRSSRSSGECLSLFLIDSSADFFSAVSSVLPMKRFGLVLPPSPITRRLSPSGSAPMSPLSPASNKLVWSSWRPCSSTTPRTDSRRSRPACTPTSATAALTIRAAPAAHETVITKRISMQIIFRVTLFIRVRGPHTKLMPRGYAFLFVPSFFTSMYLAFMGGVTRTVGLLCYKCFQSNARRTYPFRTISPVLPLGKRF